MTGQPSEQVYRFPIFLPDLRGKLQPLELILPFRFHLGKHAGVKVTQIRYPSRSRVASHVLPTRRAVRTSAWLNFDVTDSTTTQIQLGLKFHRRRRRAIAATTAR